MAHMTVACPLLPQWGNPIVATMVNACTARWLNRVSGSQMALYKTAAPQSQLHQLRQEVLREHAQSTC